MLFRRPSYRQVALLVFALVLNAVTWAQVRVAAAAAGQHDMCLQAHGSSKSADAGDPSGTVDHDTCVAHCTGLPTPFGAEPSQSSPPSLRVEVFAGSDLGDPPVTTKRSPQQPRAPPAA